MIRCGAAAVSVRTQPDEPFMSDKSDRPAKPSKPTGPGKVKRARSRINPEIVEWKGPLGLPRFDRITDDEFAPAFKKAMKQAEREIEAIAGQKAKPGFANTIERLETAGESLSRVSALFWNRAGAHSNDTIREIERDISPRLARHQSRIMMNRDLFARIDHLWERRAKLKLSLEQERVLERYWKGFVKSGAKLPRKAQKRLAAINQELATL